LNTALKKFVRDKQPPEIIKAANREKGSHRMHSTNGNGQPALNPEFAEVFVRSAIKLVAELEEIQKKDGVYEDEDIRMYTINTHALKSMLATIGEKELSAVAFKLERAGQEKDTAVMAEETHRFLNELRVVIRKLTPQKEGGEAGETVDGDIEYLQEKLLVINEACGVYNRKAVKDAINELKQKKWPLETTEILEKIAEHLLNGDYDEIMNIINKFHET
jgi:HPt (histidine-containing phosphotransfer) domain-containing protein